MSQAPPRAAIVGLGLIGGSLGIDLRRAGWRIGWIDPAIAPGGGGEAADEPLSWESLGGWRPDLVVLAAPLDAVARQLAEAPLEGHLVTSVCSLMAPLCEAARRRRLRFVAGHPFAGSEKSGPAAAAAALFRGRRWFVEPTAERTVLAMIAAAGAEPFPVDPAAHDAALAATSHLPQILSTALASMVAADRERLEPFLGDGLATFLRLAGSSFEVWDPVLRGNRGAIVEAQQRLHQAIGRILEGEGREEFERARELWRALEERQAGPAS
ncbi:MAG TPA: prephenate dehydrogenase/arogenate dehydrogenase family protein [Thermoanaerobaculia bacterium]|nr:prephenate dehydrogenase/arogenate dehydrogenase family protein [Thermoanaerobaculia bacterium]